MTTILLEIRPYQSCSIRQGSFDNRGPSGPFLMRKIMKRIEFTNTLKKLVNERRGRGYLKIGFFYCLSGDFLFSFADQIVKQEKSKKYIDLDELKEYNSLFDK